MAEGYDARCQRAPAGDSAVTAKRAACSITFPASLDVAHPLERDGARRLFLRTRVRYHAVHPWL